MWEIANEYLTHTCGWCRKKLVENVPKRMYNSLMDTLYKLSKEDIKFLREKGLAKLEEGALAKVNNEVYKSGDSGYSVTYINRADCKAAFRLLFHVTKEELTDIGETDEKPAESKNAEKTEKKKRYWKGRK